MTQYQRLISLRDTYPSTTASCQNLVMVAQDLKRVKSHRTNASFQLRNIAAARFVRALDETVRSAVQETGETNHERLLKFLANFFSQFALALPNWHGVLDEIVDGLFTHCDGKHSMISRALETSGRASILPYVQPMEQRV